MKCDIDLYNKHVIGAMTGEVTTITGIAGSMPDTSPYTNSIPSNCGGACIGGVQGVRAQGVVYTHAVEMPGYTGDERGEPEPGDRAAWDAENYPDVHANDIDTAAGIHHTLGTGANQAASGETMNDHINDTDNPHDVNKDDVGLGNVENLLNNLSAGTGPTTGDDSADGYAVGSIWIDISADKAYVCLDASEGAAVWQEVGAGGGGSGDMLKSVYDTDDDGVVDEAEAVDGVDAAGNSKYYGTDGSGTPGFYSLPAGGTVDAADVTYTPIDTSDWDGGTDPGNADDALDQLAERVKDLEDGGGLTGTWYGVELDVSETTDGVDYTRTTGSTYGYLEAEVFIKEIIKVSALKWDLRAGTYQLSIDGTDYGSPHVLGSASDDETWDLSSDNLWLLPGNHRIRMTRTSNDNWRDNNSIGGVYDGTIWRHVNSLYGGSSFPQYVLPLKIVGYIGAWGLIS